MIRKISNKHIIILLILILLILIYISRFVGTFDNNSIKENTSYFKNLPSNYNYIVENNKKNDSTFFCHIIDDYAKRELVILKAFPDRLDKSAKFNINLFPKNKKFIKKNEEFIGYSILNGGQYYSYNGKSYVLFKHPLPFIDIEKIKINHAVGLLERKGAWRTTINNPLKKIDLDFQYLKIEGEKIKMPPNPYLPLFLEALEKEEILYSPYSYIVEKDSLFQTTSSLEFLTTTGNLTLGIVQKPKLLWNLFNMQNIKYKNKVKFYGKEKEKVNKLLNNFISNEMELKSVFDIKKLASFVALKNVFTNGCDEDIYFLFNEKSNLIEPYFIKSNCLGEAPKFIDKSKINNIEYLKKYIIAQDKVSKMNIYKDIVVPNLIFEKEISFINQFNFNNYFNIDVLKVNQKLIKKSFNPTMFIKSEIISIDSLRIKIQVSNLSTYPVEIKELKYKKNRVISSLSSPQVILSRETDTITINLPENFDNLFVSKKKKKTGFILAKHNTDLFLGYSILGLNKTNYSNMLPYTSKEEIEEDLFRINSTIGEKEYIVINEQDKSISFTKLELTISTPLIIPKGYKFVIKSGTKIDIVDGGKIISHSPLYFKGTKGKPIEFFSSDKKGQGMIVFSEGKHSDLQHVIFDHLTNPKHGYWSVTGAITFYESPVNLNYVTVSNNRCEDALNIVRTTFDMKNSTISNTQSDAFDGDFVIGTITNSKFNNLGNDAIDISGSDLKIVNVQISNAGDKGLSAGEDSKMTVNNVNIETSEIAIAGKDLSIINAQNIKITNTKLAFTAFQKKPEFGPSNITVNKIVMNDVEIKYLIESTSSLIVDGTKTETSENVKDRMYGAEFGVSSAETRKSQ